MRFPVTRRAGHQPSQPARVAVTAARVAAEVTAAEVMAAGIITAVAVAVAEVTAEDHDPG